ncbi:MAG: Phenylalanine--tRNA ligase beta subunit [Chlamydiia bacterium]|nr:Phenylalanine--tRNA ligase beta subunit [Chlamydiia bacterium]
MKIPLSWIKRFLAIDKDPEEIADLLTDSGVEVEKIDRLSFDFEGVIIALVKEVHPHENADKLRVARVFDGKKDLTIVCGAPNLVANKKVVLAPIGAILETNSDKPFVLKKAKIRGIESKGMMCTEKELGIGDSHEGLLYLDDNAPVGMDFAEYYKDPVFDVTLTPNLGYCRSILGVCRELARFCDEEICHPPIQIEKSTGKNINEYITVSNELKELCPQYGARIVSGLEVKASPYWMRDLLEKAGIKPVNNIVDVTNYVSHELGQPLHAYDYSTLKEKSIDVRESRDGEKITTLDGKQRELRTGHILICSSDEPIGLGGIMGSDATSVSDKTHTVVIEAAEFCPSHIRKSSRELKLRTDASSRFENLIDSEGLLFALDYAAFLMQEIAGGSVAAGVLHEAVLYRPAFLTVRLSRINKILGTKLSLSEVETFLLSLGFTATTDGEDLFQLKIPSWRNDIKEEIDIIEEVARVYGYNNIVNHHMTHVTSHIPHHPLYIIEKLLRAKLSALGLQEFLTCSLISKELCGLKIDHGLFEATPVEVMHAKSVDQSLLRPSLLPGLLGSMAHNKNNRNFQINAFEVGKIFSKGRDGKYLENSSLGILLSGLRAPHHFDKENKSFDFFDMKGIIENLFSSLHIKNINFERSNHPTFHPGCQVNVLVNKDVVATFGKVHPEMTGLMKLEEETFFAEINVYLLEKYRTKHISFEKIPTLPSSSRDVTFTVDRQKELAEVFDLLKKAPFPELKKSSLQNIYIDEKNNSETKNVTFRFIYRDDNKTLDDNAINSCHEKVIAYLSKAL